MKWRPTSPADRQLAALWAAVAVAVVPAVALVGLGSFRVPSCLFRAATGVACPSCGATRAFEALAHGDLATALCMNPLVVIGSLAFVVGGLLAPVWQRCGGRVPDLRGVIPVRVGLAAALLCNWVYLWVRGI
jgi:hypothetical protein